MGDPLRCYHVMVLFCDLTVPSVLIGHGTKDCDYKQALYMERHYGRLNINSVSPLVSISE